MIRLYETSDSGEDLLEYCTAGAHAGDINGEPTLWNYRDNVQIFTSDDALTP